MCSSNVSHPARRCARLFAMVCTLLFLMNPLIPDALSRQNGSNGKDLRIKMDGTGLLYKKVIVRSDNATIHEEPEGPSRPIGAFAVFHQLKTDDGQEKKGAWVRVGKANGTPLGWVEEKHLIQWNTRFILSPEVPTANAVFALYRDADCREEVAKLSALSPGLIMLCPILGTPAKEDEPVFNIAFFTGRATSEPIKQASDISELKLEIVFVIDTTASMNPLLAVSKNVVHRMCEVVSQSPELKGSVRFGLVEYQDATPGLRPSYMRSKLTDNLNELEKTLATVEVATIGSEETKNDVLAGLLTAIEHSGWEKNSSKHIILLGNASGHISHCGAHTGCKYVDPKTGVCKKNTTGLDIRRILDRCRKVVGSEVEKALGSITIHTVRGIGEDSADHQECKAQFRELARNNGAADGICEDIDANKVQDRERVSRALAEMLTVGVVNIQKSRQGMGKDVGSENKFEEALYRVIRAQGPPTTPMMLRAWAREKDHAGNVVAQRKVMVSELELRRYAATLKFVREQLQTKHDPSVRLDVEAILGVLQRATVALLTGQIVSQSENVRPLIAELPLKTGVLEVRAKDIATMSDGQFSKWLDGLRTAYERIDRCFSWCSRRACYVSEALGGSLRKRQCPSVSK